MELSDGMPSFIILVHKGIYYGIKMGEESESKEYLEHIPSVCKTLFNHPQEIPTYQTLSNIGILKHARFQNAHLGQRKLLLNELKFYNMIPRNATVIYSGSANGEHTPLILEMYPYINLILVDPAFHWMRYKYRYIYKDASKVSESNKAHYLTRSKDFKEVMCIDGIERDVLNCDSFGKFVKPDFSVCRVWVIQDYMTPELGKQIRDSFGTEPLYHISDIRTTLLGGGSPTDLDCLYNGALQILILKELEPELSHLKFRIPNWSTQESVSKMPDWILPYFEKVKKYGVDMIKDYKEGKHKYMSGTILAQPWAPSKSYESRLITKGDDFKYYSYDEYRGKFNYFNTLRGLGYFPKYYSLFKRFPKNPYDASLDCALEMETLMEYTKGNIPKSIMLCYRIDEVTRYSFNHGYKAKERVKIFALRDKFEVVFEDNWRVKKLLVTKEKVSIEDLGEVKQDEK